MSVFEAKFVARDNNFTANRGGWCSFDLYPRQLGNVNGEYRNNIVVFGRDKAFVIRLRKFLTIEYFS
jgi:hypothetical protein